MGLADRVAAVRLTVDVRGLTAGLANARQQINDLGRDAVSSAARAQASWDKVARGFTVVGVASGAVLGLAVKKSMDFEAAMSAVQAATQQSGAALAALKQTAIDAGAATQFSATESADAITAMAKAGVAASDIMGGGLSGALDLAAAGQLGVADAAEIAATAMTQFGLAGKDLPHVADLLAAGAGKAQGGVADLANAMKYVGPVAKGMGISIEETTGTLALFAKQGIIGEQAGTSLRGVLLSLTSPSQQATDVMAQLGINLYDANGAFIGVSGAADQLHRALGPLDEATRNQALGQIFGNQQITAARILYEGGAAAVADWTGKVNDAGFATRQAGQLTDNLRGDLERLGGALDTALIATGSSANGVLRDMTQKLTGVVDVYNDMPGPVQKGATAMLAVVSAVGLTGGALLALAPRISATKRALEDMGRTGVILQRGLSGTRSLLMGPWGAVLGAAAIAAIAFGNAQLKAKQHVDELRESLDQQTGALTANTRQAAFKALQDNGGIDIAKRLGVSLADVTSAALGETGARQRLADARGAAAEASHQPNTPELLQWQQLTDRIGDQSGALAKSRQEWADQKAAAADAAATELGAAGSIAGTTGALDDQAQAAQDAEQALQDLKTGLDALNGVNLDARAAERAYQAAIDDATASVKEHGKTLNTNTDAGRQNEAALDAIASRANDLAKAILDETGSEESRRDLIQAAEHFGMSKREAKKYADQVLQIPKRAGTEVDLSGVPRALSQIQQLEQALRNIDGRSATVVVNRKIAVQNDVLTGATHRASGGYIDTLAAGGLLLPGPGVLARDILPTVNGAPL
jgi:TP901 family phage tail tape measure protein